MSQPTTSILLNSTTPAAPAGNQNAKPQSDGATPLQSITLYPQKATSSLLGVVVPDGTSITVDGTGKISAAPAASSWHEQVPTGTLDGTNTVFTLSATPIAGSLTLFLNIDQREGKDFALSGATVTFTIAPKPTDTGWFLARYQS